MPVLSVVPSSLDELPLEAIVASAIVTVRRHHQRLVTVVDTHAADQVDPANAAARWLMVCEAHGTGVYAASGHPYDRVDGEQVRWADDDPRLAWRRDLRHPDRWCLACRQDVPASYPAAT